MIKFNTDADIIDYLMTSEFDGENLSPSDLKSLLKLFRHQFRLEHSRTISKSHEIEKINKKLQKLERHNKALEEDIKLSDQRLETLQSKKLSLKERIKGKIL